MTAELQFNRKLNYSAVHYASQQDLTLLTSIVAPLISNATDRCPVDLVATLDRSEIQK